VNANFGTLLTQLVATFTHWAKLFASLFLVLIVAVALADLLGFRTPYLSVNSSGTNLAAVIAAAAFALRG
jgi:p-aminobenzoyl-glutamate transporter AbgT